MQSYSKEKNQKFQMNPYIGKDAGVHDTTRNKKKHNKKQRDKGHVHTYQAIWETAHVCICFGKTVVLCHKQLF